MLTYGPYEILQLFQGPLNSRGISACDWKLLVGGFWVLVGTPLLMRRSGTTKLKTFPAPFVKRDRERVLIEDLLVDDSGAADPNVRKFSPMEVLRLSGSYEVLGRLCSDFRQLQAEVAMKLLGREMKRWLVPENIRSFSIFPLFTCSYFSQSFQKGCFRATCVSL